MAPAAWVASALILSLAPPAAPAPAPALGAHYTESALQALAVSPQSAALDNATVPDYISRNLGQYSPYFPQSSSYEAVPDGCEVEYVHHLERHGSRYPTKSTYRGLEATLRKIAKHLKKTKDDTVGSGEEDDAEAEEGEEEAEEEEWEEEEEEGDEVAIEKHGRGLDPSLAWLREWTSKKKREDGGLRNKLGHDELVPYGQWEGYLSGSVFRERYGHLFEHDNNDSDVEADVNRSFESRQGAGRVCEALAGISTLARHICQWSMDLISSHLSSPTSDVGRQAVLSRPFVRASGAERVVATSRFFLDGYAQPSLDNFRRAQPISSAWPPSDRADSRMLIGRDDIPAAIAKRPKPHRRIPNLPWPDVVIPEARGKHGSNNTLDVYTCQAFERDFRDNPHAEGVRLGKKLQKRRARPIRKRIQSALGADRRGQRVRMTTKDVMALANLCAFHTVASLDPYLFSSPRADNEAAAATSPFCELFQPEEFHDLIEASFDVEKAYGFASQNPLRRALAIGYWREVLARINGSKPLVHPTPTSINTTLDLNEETFPTLDDQQGRLPRAFVDFTHDNQLAPVIASLGLSDFGGAKKAKGWKTSATTPFAGRLTIEELHCPLPNNEQQHGNGKDTREARKVRVFVNDLLVAPFSQDSFYAQDRLGRGGLCRDATLCSLSEFVDRLSAWVERDQEWEKCYHQSTSEIN